MKRDASEAKLHAVPKEQKGCPCEKKKPTGFPEWECAVARLAANLLGLPPDLARLPRFSR